MRWNSLYERILLTIDADWVPKADGTSLYIRPDHDGGTDPYPRREGRAVSISSLLYCRRWVHITLRASQPVNIYVEDEFVRAVVGGTGAM